ncbi:hypothetical protein VTK26DRAFT_9086 [Humicola hyalothermophila]
MAQDNDKIRPSDTATPASETSSKFSNLNETRQRILESQVTTAATPINQPPTTALSALWSWRRKTTSSSGKPKPTDIATPPSVFDDPALAKFFAPHPSYENIHRFDPSFRWTWAEERPLVRRIDWRVTAWSCVAFFALDLDRSNIAQANTDNFLDDLGLDTNDFNLGQTVFRVAFLAAELPSQVVGKKIGPDRWIPAQMILWSLVSAAQFWLKGRQSFLVTRALIGLLQGGFIPDVVLNNELPLRLALFWMANRLTDVISPLLAYGLLRLRGYQGYEGWRWLFLLEGIFTLLIGIWSVFGMVPSPTQTRAPWRPNGWFTEHEEKIMVNRILRDDPSKSDMHNRQAITPKLLWESLCDYDLWPIYLLGLTFSIPAGPPDQYLTLTLRQLGFDTFDSNLLSIPCQVATTVNMLLLTYISERLNQRALPGLFVQLWLLPCVVALAVLPSGENNRWGAYALVTVLLSYPSPHPLQVGWCSRNANAVRARTVSASLYNMAVQVSSIISANVYRADDRPEYRRGNRVLVGIACMNVVLYLGVKAYYVWRNRRREEVWSKMTAQERERYLETTEDRGTRMAAAQDAAPRPKVDPSNPDILRWDDIGLTLIHNFITESEEAAIIEAFHARDPEKEGKRRISQHFGYHFDYTTFGASETDFTPVPPYIADLLPRLPVQDYLPDQFTVQYYPPGSGIPPHVDTHSMFGEALYSLSLGSAVPMCFRMSGPNDARKMRLPKRSATQPGVHVESEGEQAPTAAAPVVSSSPSPSPSPSPATATAGQAQETQNPPAQHPSWELLLPPRSLLLMTGPSRYGYTHGIRPRKTDVVDGRAVPRRGRYSITMRTIRRGDEIGCDCAYPGVCDARIREEMAAAAEAAAAAAAARGKGGQVVGSYID